MSQEQAMAAQTHTQPLPNIHAANAIIDATTGASMEYWHLIKSPEHKKAWTNSFANKLGQLAQGIGGQVKGTDTIFFIPYQQIPIDGRGDITYGRIVVNH